jgi:hypothetical protein
MALMAGSPIDAALNGAAFAVVVVSLGMFALWLLLLSYG